MEKGQIKVLIAEDDFLIAEEISRALKSLGYALAGIAPNGIKAVNLTISLKPDVVLMDIKMPKMDGLEAAHQIFEKCSTPIVIITAHESQDLVEKASELGIAAYLTKPPKAEEIDRAITIALARHQDLLKYKKLITELEENQRKLDLSNVSKDRFFSMLAHDLRGPVSSLSVFSDQIILNFDALEKSELLEYLSVIQNTSKSLSDLLENMLLWAGFQINRVKFKKSRIYLTEMVNSVEMLLLAALQHKKINFQNKVPENFYVLADADMVSTILRNLISNAIKFTPVGGLIQVLAEEDSVNLIISVKDNGIGISDENKDKIFQTDQQFSSLGTQGEKGTGLGLILCNEMVRKNGGEIWVESIPSHGTTFSFTLPRSQE